MSSANAELAMYSLSTLAGSAPFSYETSANSRFSPPSRDVQMPRVATPNASRLPM